jgi:hypothetical protein
MNNRWIVTGAFALSLTAWGCGEAPLSSGEIDAYEDVGSIESAVLGTYVALPALPVVTTAYGFALTASADNGSARLGFMFTDATYRQALLNAGTIQNMGGSYDGPNAYATYQITGGAWSAYEGRTTPQTYAYSELVVAGSASYYSTNYPSFGGLIAAIRNGGKGTYALTPAFTTRKAHSITVAPGGTDVYALAAQSGSTGLTFSKFPIAQFGVVFPNYWTNPAVLAASATTVASPQVVMAGAKLAAAYVLGADAVIRATDSPSTVASAANLPVIGGCTNATAVDVAWTGTELYAACLGSTGAVTVKRASLANLASVVWTTVSTSLPGGVSALDLEASTTGVSIAVRVGTALKVYNTVTDTFPTYDEVRPGSFDLARTSNGIVLAVCDLSGDRTLRTWVSP